MSNMRLGQLILVVFFGLKLHAQNSVAPRTFWMRDLTPFVGGADSTVLEGGPTGSVYFVTQNQNTQAESLLRPGVGIGRYSSEGGLIFFTNLFPELRFGTSIATTDAETNLISLSGFVDLVATDYLLRSGFLITKTMPHGNTSWSNRFSGIGGLREVATDSASDIYVGASAWNLVIDGRVFVGASGSSALLVKISSTGEVLWTKWWNSSAEEDIRGLTVDESDNIWISIARRDGSGLLQKFNPAGQLLLDLPQEPIGFLNRTGAQPFAYRFFNYWMQGPFELQQFNGSGEVILRTNYNSAGFHRFTGFVHDPDRAVYMLAQSRTHEEQQFAGKSWGTSLAGDAALFKVDRAGTLLWGRNKLLSSGEFPSFAVSGPDVLFYSGTVSYREPQDGIDVLGDGGGLFISKLAVLPEDALPIITTQPRPIDVVEGRFANLQKERLIAAAASASPLTFQWYFNGMPITGATQSNLFFDRPPRTATGRYKLSISNPLGGVETDEALVTVRIPPTHLRNEEPVQVQARSGEEVVLVPPIEGDEPLGFRWQKLDSVPGFSFRFEVGTNRVLRFTNVNFFDGGVYLVTATNLYGSVTALFGLTVESAPVTLVPENTVPHVAGTTLRLNSNLGGTAPLTYQWYEGNIPIPGETRANLTLTNLFTSGPFYAIAENPLGRGTGTVTQVEMMYPPFLQRSIATGAWQIVDLELAGEALYVAAHTNAAQKKFARVSRLDLDLDEEWNVLLQADVVTITAAMVDHEHELYFTGSYGLGLTNGTTRLRASLAGGQPFLGKVDGTGTIKWLQNVWQPGERTQKLLAAHDSIWVLGTERTSRTGVSAPYRVRLSRFSPQGVEQVALVFTNAPTMSPPADVFLDPQDFALDGGTNLIVAGRQSAAGTAFPWLAKYSLGGDLVWSQTIPSARNPSLRGTAAALAQDATGHLYVAGQYGETLRYGFLAKFSPAGVMVWKNETFSTCCNGEGAWFTTLQFMPNENIHLGGFALSAFTFLGSSYQPGGFVFEIMPEGKVVWPAFFGTRDVQIHDAVSSGAVTYVGGVFGQSVSTESLGQYLGRLGEMPVAVTNRFSEFILGGGSPIPVRPLVFGTGPLAFTWEFNGATIPDENRAFFDAQRLTGAGTLNLLITDSKGSVLTNSLKISSLRTLITNGTPALELSLAPATAYLVQVRDELSDAWAPLTNVVGSGAPVLFPVEPRELRFFRMIKP
jgi:hypothetical protein